MKQLGPKSMNPIIGKQQRAGPTLLVHDATDAWCIHSQRLIHSKLEYLVYCPW